MTFSQYRPRSRVGVFKKKLNHLVASEAVDQTVGLLLAPVHRHGDADSEAAEDLLVLCLLSVGDHVLDRHRRLGAEHHQAHRNASGLTCNNIFINKRHTVMTNISNE